MLDVGGTRRTDRHAVERWPSFNGRLAWGSASRVVLGDWHSDSVPYMSDVTRRDHPQVPPLRVITPTSIGV